MIKNSPPNLQNMGVLNSSQEDEIDLFELLKVFKFEWKLLSLFMLLGLVVGVFLISWLRNEFESDVLLQIDSSKRGSAMVEMGSLFNMDTPADAEIRLIKSRKVLASVAQKEHLIYTATPIGVKNRLLKKEGRMDLSLLKIPDLFKTEKFYARAFNSEEFEVLLSNGDVLLKGVVGETYRKLLGKDTFAICVEQMLVLEEQKFLLRENSVLNTVALLKQELKVAEDGKKTNIITMSYRHRYPDKAASVLNTVANTYLRQNVEMRSAEAEKTLAFLEEQLPSVKIKLDSAEQALTNYRYNAGTVDLSAEAKVTLERQVSLSKELLTLEQQLQENARLYKEDHPSMQAILLQQERLKQEIKKENAKVKNLPTTQQDVMSLQQEVAIQNGLYTSMLNNIQQLKVVRVGELGNVRIVDFAEISALPVKPQKKIVLLGSLLGSLFLGALLVFLKHSVLNRGVSSASLIERETGLSVYSKIPKFNIKLKQKAPYTALALEHPNEMAVERLRSLRTALEFSFLASGGKVLAIAGIAPNDGKSFVSTNLAVVFRQLVDKKVLLIDCDLRKKHAGKRLQKGLSDIMYKQTSIEDVLSKSSNLCCDYIGPGTRLSTPSELVASPKFGQLIQEFRRTYDIILIDTPPLNYYGDAQWVAKHSDFALLVIRSGAYSIDIIKESLKVLEVAVDNRAIVLNHCKYESMSYGYGRKNDYGIKSS